MRKFLKCSLFAALIGGSTLAYHMLLRHLSDGFSPSHIYNQELSFSQIEEPIDEETAAILKQKFFYKGKGSQCFVFESEDKMHILKFFRFPRYQSLSLSSHFPLPQFLTEIEENKKDFKRQKLHALFSSCLLAYTELKEESGLLYLHLNRNSNLKIQILCQDRLKRDFTVDLDQVEFILQKKAELLYPYLARLIHNKEGDEAKRALSNLVKLLNGRLEKGIFDSDSVIAKNAGFCGDRAMFLDTGEFHKDLSFQEDPEKAKQELFKITRKLEDWLTKKDPELALFFKHELFLSSCSISNKSAFQAI